MDKQERNYGIDLLRIVLMYMVCMLHILGQGGVLNACEAGSVRYGVFWLLEVCSYCAVNGFALISGYTASVRRQNYGKLVGMWAQAWFYSFLVTVLLQMAEVGRIRDLVETMLLFTPVLSNYYWYFTAYFVLFLMMPMLNGYLFNLDDQKAKKVFIILLLLFSAMTTLRDPFSLQKGFSPTWIIVLYCLGAIAKRIRLFEQRSTVLLLIGFVGSTLLSWTWLVFMGSGSLISYVSPTIVLNGLLLVVIFSRIRVKGIIIRRITPLVFGVYLFQLNTVIWEDVLKGAMEFAAGAGVIQGVVMALGCAMLLFLAGLLVEWLRSTVERIFKMERIYQSVVHVLDSMLEKMFMFLR